MKGIGQTHPDNQSQFPLDMGILHHSRKRVAFSGVSRHYTLFYLLIPPSYHREVEKKRTITGLPGTYLSLVH